MEADLVFALGYQVVYSGISSHVLHGRCGLLRRTGRPGYQQVKVARGVAASPQRPGGRHLLHAGKRQQVKFQPLRGVLSLVNAEAAGAPPVILDALAQLVELLLAHARQFGQAAAFDGFRKLIDAADLRSRPEESHGLRSHTRQLHQLQQAAAAILCQQFLAQGKCAGLGNRFQVRRHAFADARNLKQARSVFRHRHQIHRCLLHGFSRTAIAQNAISVRPVDLEQIGRLLQQTRHRGIVHEEMLREPYRVDRQSEYRSVASAPHGGLPGEAPFLADVAAFRRKAQNAASLQVRWA